MIELKSPIDLEDPAARPFLRGVQGNIIRGHGRDHTAHVFVRFGANVPGVRAWIAKFAGGPLTSADEQHNQTRAYRSAGGDGEPLGGFLLSHTGYAALGIPEAARPTDPFFRAGMKQHNSVQQDIINDPPPEKWEPQFQGDIHAMVLLADDNRDRLGVSADTVCAELAAAGAETFVERGDILRFDFGPPRGLLEIEHFGHQDGVSNPRMVVKDILEEKEKRGSTNWNPEAALNLVFVQEPGSIDRLGSYMVFRKLEQNVRAFHDAKVALAKLLNIDVDGAAGLMVGRHRDGTPLMPTVTPDAAADPNDFNYSLDRPAVGAAARVCPFHSHIRRTNPRGDVPHYIGAPETFERSMRIARRGITYGARPRLYDPDPSALPSKDVGLLFMCFQSSLRQFAIQQSGSDSDVFPFNTAFTGLESVIGQAADPANVRPQPWPFRDPNDPQATRDFKMMDFVKMRGGEYFLAPSIPFLHSL